MNKLNVKIKRINNNFNDIPLPRYETEDSSGMDVRAALEIEYNLQSGKVALIPTNLILQIPKGYEVQVRPRSGLAAKHGIGVLNSPGTIDADYRGEVKIILFNFSDKDFIIKRSDRIAQLVLGKVYRADLDEVQYLDSTKRGDGGFGHTGYK
ncbi:deoxyuridine 5'-triphosphate nucleotidohydrolase [bacterium BMS3Abin04]|nr:deoxyuridine 5'-triphosphate nucleotidohydrolase [bacterium BMS3Abin04]